MKDVPVVALLVIVLIIALGGAWFFAARDVPGPAMFPAAGPSFPPAVAAPPAEVVDAPARDFTATESAAPPPRARDVESGTQPPTEPPATPPGATAIAPGETGAQSTNLSASTAPAEPTPPPPGDVPAAADKLVPLNPQKTVLLDKPGNRLLLKSKVALRKGLLEMLLCKQHTKEHESILAIDADAYTIHAGLLALGAEPGQPVQFIEREDPETGAFSIEVVPPKGRRIDVVLQWTDADGRLRRVPAQQWIRTSTHKYYTAELEALPEGVVLPRDGHLRYDPRQKELAWYGEMTPAERDEQLKLSSEAKFQQAVQKLFADSQPRPMTAHWVFAGSMYRVDEETGKRHYLGEEGYLICVANFSVAVLDVAEASSASGDPSGGGGGLEYEANPDAIPPPETEVTIELIPAPENPPRGNEQPK